MDNHLRIEELEASFIQDGTGQTLVLAIRSLSIVLSKEGLDVVIAALIPDEPLRASIRNDREQSGCAIQLQATRFGFHARIQVHLRTAADAPGSILIHVDPYNRWAPFDRIMREIALTNLQKQASTRSGIQKRKNNRYELDLQTIIRERLLDSTAPIRWDARLDGIESSADEIRVRFVSVVSTD